jgi:hypothetical protein
VRSGWSQQGTWSGRGAPHAPSAEGGPPAKRRDLPHTGTHGERGQPVSLPSSRASGRCGPPQGGQVWERGASEGCSGREQRGMARWSDVSCATASHAHACRRPRGLCARAQLPARQDQECVARGAVATAGASLRPRWHWHQINWRRAHRHVRRVQSRLVQAAQAGKRRQVRALQPMLTRAGSGRAVAVKRVTTTRGTRTPGVDPGPWDPPAPNAPAVADRQHHSGRPLPRRRRAMPQSHGGTRDLGRPTRRDRARQALHWLALEPVADTRADPNSSGVRPGRATADAMGPCSGVWSRQTSAPWV